MTSILNSLIAAVPFILLFAHSEKTEDFFCPTDRSVTGRYRGFFALAVILHHMAQRVSSGGLLMVYFDAGYLAVAAFFFFSGYGLMKKGTRQKKGFFRRRLSSLLIPYIIGMGIYWILYAVTGDVKSFSSLMAEHFNNKSGISFLWYVFAYLSWILFLGIALQFIRKDVQILFTACLFAAGYIAFCLFALPDFFWIYDTVIMIPFGCAWAHYEKNILARIRRQYSPVLISALLLFLISCAGHFHPVFRVPSYMISSVLFMIFLNTATMKRRPASKALRFLGEISYEIYILHGIPVTFLKDVIPNEALWTLSVLVFAVISACLMHETGKKTWMKIFR